MSSRQKIQYPKTYATVISREGSDFIAEAETGERFQLSVGQRTGFGSQVDIQPGLRIKIYRRPGENYKFRFVGS